MKLEAILLVLFSFITISLEIEVKTNCSKLKKGQYICPNPQIDHIDKKTQQIRGCTKESKARVECLAATGIICLESGNSTFQVDDYPCKWTNGYHFDTALLFSIFLGMFGIDRFYLGYPAIGLMKLFTLGFMFIGQLLDVILIATQILGPADGSNYVIPFYGPKLEFIKSDNWTYRLENW